MLVLSRKRNEVIRINDDIVVTIVEIDRDKVRVGIDAPQDVRVHRAEVYDAIQKERRRADLKGAWIDPPDSETRRMCALTPAEMQAVFAELRYKDWHFHVLERRDMAFLQLRFVAPDSATGEPATMTGRKWYLSPFATRSELVMTALKAVLTAEEHEAREQFLYRGVAIFGPHVDIDGLVEAAAKEDRRVAAS